MGMEYTGSKLGSMEYNGWNILEFWTLAGMGSRPQAQIIMIHKLKTTLEPGA
jgi:hypothetical protein